MNVPSALILFPLLLFVIPPTQAQDHRDIISTYQQERMRVLAEQHLKESGGYLQAAPLRPLPVPQVAALRAMLRRSAQAMQNQTPKFKVTAWYLAGNMRRRWYENRFGDIDWTYLGSTGATRLDTMLTHELRARLQGTFGDPTQTIADYRRLEAEAEAPAQFEYWFMLNGSIPFRVMDVNGPFERGLVVATEREYRDRLSAMRQSFLKRILDPEAAAPFADYYFEPITDTWFLTGYDGSGYILEPIDPPGLSVGSPDINTLSSN